MPGFEQNELTATPLFHNIATAAVGDFTCDVGPSLPTGAVATAPTVKVYDNATGADVTAASLVGVASLAGTKATQTFTGAAMTVGGQYRVVWAFPIGSGKVVPEITYLVCVG